MTVRNIIYMHSVNNRMKEDVLYDRIQEKAGEKHLLFFLTYISMIDIVYPSLIYI